MAADGRQAGLDGDRDVGPEPQRPLSFDDERQDALQEDGLAADEILAALDPREDEQVLDQAVQPLGFGRDVR